MKKLYPLAILLLTIILLSNRTTAQTYSGGTYSAQRNGNWHGDNIWNPTEPPSTCLNCLININSGVTVTLNANVTLKNSSLLVIGTPGNTAATELLINASTGTDWASSYNVILSNDGSNPANAIQLINSSASVNAIGANNDFDGIFTTFEGTPTTYFKQVGNGVSAYSGATASNSRSLSNSNTLSGPVTLSSTGTLPIILSDFNALLDDNQVDLTWTTDLEVNSDHFAVQRSTNGGSSWETLGTVAAQGMSSISVNYSYTDATPASGVSEYRLQLVDRDGQSAYSTIRTIRTGQVSTISIFPNPTKDYVNITLGGEATTGSLDIRLLSQAGQLLVEKKVSNAGGTTVTLPVSNYPQGNYLILVTGPDGTQQVNKLLISK